MANDTGTDERLTRELANKLAHSGLRLTSQREHVYGVLLKQTDHPTADEVYIRAKAAMPEISMATVYNTLETLAKCGLIKQVNVERSATRYCSNMTEHCHFYCDDCGGVHDVPYEGGSAELPISLPEQLKARHVEISIRGTCKDPATCPHKNNN